MAIAALEGELRNLPATDLESLFEALRDRVLEADDLLRTPAGMAGLGLVTKSHPPCQPRLVTMLEELPVERLGPWAVAGWEDVLTEGGARARFEALIGVWATQDQNPGLRAVAAQVRQLPTPSPGRRH